MVQTIYLTSSLHVSSVITEKETKLSDKSELEKQHNELILLNERKTTRTNDGMEERID